MKKLLSLTIIIFLFSVSSSFAVYNIDGDILNDWGIDLNAPGADLAGYLDANVPGGTVNSETEDNADKNSSWFQVGPGFTDVGNRYDAEAMYYDNDDTYAYVAIITGLSPDELRFPAGDIFFSTASNPFTDLSYEFALDVFTGNFYNVGGMEDVSYPVKHGVSNPWRLTRNLDETVKSENAFIGQTDLVYSSLINTHHVIETRIPLAWLDPEGEDVWIHWTMGCGNDYLNLHGVSTPEPATALLFGSGILGFFGLRKRKRLG